MRILAAVAGVGLLFAAVTVVAELSGGSSGSFGHRLAVPGPGEAHPAALADGEPVFVVAHEQGDVSVVSAVGSHLDVLVVWCGDAQQFVEPGGASYFDAYGRYLAGPAPVGLAPFDTTVDGEMVRVGSRRPAPPRQTSTSHGSGSDCMASEGSHGGVSHDEEAVAVQDIPWTETGRFVTVEGFLDLSGDTARFCAPRPVERRCAAGAPAVVQSFNAKFRPFDWVASFEGTGWMEGTFIARVLPGRRLTDIAMRKRFIEGGDYNFEYGTSDSRQAGELPGPE